MPEICRFYGIIIKMFFQDHSPAHFHAEYQDYEAIFDINSLKIINGNLPPRAKSMVLEWAGLHKEELKEDWLRAQKPETLFKIEPLK
ncbi:MAG: DUF4160 domain-containing protein [Ignavibacteria bacterium]|nr:DUF4160 domain-containing protein [Ignavibacteria bacterium]